MSSQQAIAEVKAELSAQSAKLVELLTTLAEEQQEVLAKFEAAINQLDDATATQLQEVLLQLRGNTDRINTAIAAAEAISMDEPESTEEPPEVEEETEEEPEDDDDVTPVDPIL